MLSFSKKEICILNLLYVNSELYGLEMVEKSQAQLKRGTIYVTLKRMEQKNLIQSRQEPRPKSNPGIPHRLYHLTNIGKQKYQLWMEYAQKLTELTFLDA